ncbi:hypothetical protein Tco_0334050, partial [Tanacetum coccineum]
DHPLKHMENRGIFDSGCSGHMTGNRAHLEDYQELSTSGKGTIRLGNLVFDDVAFVKELGHFNLSYSPPPPIPSSTPPPITTSPPPPIPSPTPPPITTSPP